MGWLLRLFALLASVFWVCLGKAGELVWVFGLGVW